jgi:transcriptional regulator with XRE-family HTH domain
MSAAHLSYAKMAAALGVHVNTVSLALERLDLKKTPRWSARKFHTNPVITKLREVRMNKCVTIDQLAIKSGWDRSIVSEWERGARRMHVPGLVDVAQALGYEVVLRRIGE